MEFQKIILSLVCRLKLFGYTDQKPTQPTWKESTPSQRGKKSTLEEINTQVRKNMPARDLEKPQPTSEDETLVYVATYLHYL